MNWEEVSGNLLVWGLALSLTTGLILALIGVRPGTAMKGLWTVAAATFTIYCGVSVGVVIQGVGLVLFCLGLIGFFLVTLWVIWIEI